MSTGCWTPPSCLLLLVIHSTGICWWSMLWQLVGGGVSFVWASVILASLEGLVSSAGLASVSWPSPFLASASGASFASLASLNRLASSASWCLAFSASLSWATSASWCLAFSASLSWATSASWCLAFSATLACCKKWFSKDSRLASQFN